MARIGICDDVMNFLVFLPCHRLRWLRSGGDGGCRCELGEDVVVQLGSGGMVVLVRDVELIRG